MRTKKFLINSVFSVLEQITLAVIGLLLPRIMIFYYGSELNGLVVSITQFIGYFKLAEAGISTASIFALFKPIANNDSIEIAKIVKSTQSLYVKSGIVFLVGVLILSIIYPIIVNTDNLSFFEISYLVFIIGIFGGLDFFIFGKFRVLITADQKQFMISIASMAYLISNFILVYILSKNNTDIYIMKSFAMISFLAKIIPLYIYSFKKYRFIFNSKNVKPAHIPHRWDAFYIQILGATQVATPIILATIFVNLTQVSIFSVYLMVFSSLTGVLGIFSSSLSSIFGDIIAKKELKLLNKSYSQFETVYYIIITVIFSVSILTISSFIGIYSRGVTDTNYNWTMLGILLGINALLYNLKVPQGMVVMSSGKFKETKVQSTIQVLIIVFFGILLGYYYGIIGIVFSSILSNIYRVIDLIIYVPKYIINNNMFKTIQKVIISIGIFSTSIFLSIIIKLDINDIISWVLYGVVLVIGYFVLTLSIFYTLNRNDINETFSRILRIVGMVKK